MSRTITCVVGDDHAILRQALVAYLRATPGIEVVGEAADGDAVLGLMERRAPTVAVVDLHMQGSNGIEICAAVAERGLGAKVLIYTGDDNVRLLDEALTAGAAGFVLKAAPLGDLARAVEIVAGGGRYIEPALGGALLAHRRDEADLLSEREREILALLADGHSTDETARELYLSPATIRSYTEKTMHKLGARNRLEMVAIGIRRGLT